jgi:hypothetical protein
MLDYTIEIPSLNSFPIKLNMCDSIDCPICEISLSDELNIDLDTFDIDENTTINCKDCNLQLKFKIVQI